MIKKQTHKSCCGSSVTFFVTDEPLLKNQIDVFKEAGFKFPDNFLKAGIFYAHKDGLVATCAYGSRRIAVRCSGSQCGELITKFENILGETVRK